MTGFLLPLISILRGLIKNWKIVLPIAVGVIGMAYASGAVKSYFNNKEDKQILECNEKQLEDQITTLNALLEQQKQDRLKLSIELEEIQIESEERRKSITDLKNILNNQDLPDDQISERTREFFRELNKQAKELQKNEF